jgi:hypothetical protein
MAMAEQLGERNGRPAACLKRSPGPASRPARPARAIAARAPGDALGRRPRTVDRHPDAFIAATGTHVVRPFTGFSLVPSQDDWLGLTGRIQNSQPQRGAVQLDIGSGALIADADGKQLGIAARPHPGQCL